MDSNYSLKIVGGGIVGMTILREAISKIFKNQVYILNSNAFAWTSLLKTAKFIINKILD